MYRNGRLCCISRLALESDKSMTTIYVGNLPFSATEADVRTLFEQHGTVESVKLVNDRETGRPRGFGFVEMPTTAAQTAIQHMNGFQMGGRALRVNEAREREARPPRQTARW
jgi:RNA recognition motif-containing protein